MVFSPSGSFRGLSKKVATVPGWKFFGGAESLKIWENINIESEGGGGCVGVGTSWLYADSYH